MSTASIVLQLVSVGLLVYILVKILEVEKNVEYLKETEPERSEDEMRRTDGIFRPIAIATPPNVKEEIVELENDESVADDEQ